MMHVVFGLFETPNGNYAAADSAGMTVVTAGARGKQEEGTTAVYDMQQSRTVGAPVVRDTPT